MPKPGLSPALALVESTNALTRPRLYHRRNWVALPPLYAGRDSVHAQHRYTIPYCLPPSMKRNSRGLSRGEGICTPAILLVPPLDNQLCIPNLLTMRFERCRPDLVLGGFHLLQEHRQAYPYQRETGRRLYLILL